MPEYLLSTYFRLNRKVTPGYFLSAYSAQFHSFFSLRNQDRAALFQVYALFSRDFDLTKKKCMSNVNHVSIFKADEGEKS